MQREPQWATKPDLQTSATARARELPPKPASWLHASLGNRAVSRIVQAKLQIGQPGDAYEREADHVAEQVAAAHTGHAPTLSGGPDIQRKCDCGGTCDSCSEEKAVRTKPRSAAAGAAANPRIISGTGGSPLPAPVRSFFETHMHHDFGGVRVHTGPEAEASAASLNARAFTSGRDIVFGAGQYRTGDTEGVKLLAHELTHVVQQSAPESRPMLQRQLITPLAAGDGFGGLMDRDRDAANSFMSPSIQVCARPLQSNLGLLFNHAFIQAPPFRYAVITPLCTPTDGGHDDVIQGTVGQKWDNSPDPCGRHPVHCVPCRPKPGVVNVAACLRNAFLAYHHTNLYKALGPNSNTFAGTLARSCCDGMVPAPPTFGSIPGWSDPPAPFRPGRCPPGPIC